MKTLEKLILGSIGIIVFPLVIYLLLKWNTHEWEVLHRCSLGYDFELIESS